MRSLITNYRYNWRSRWDSKWQLLTERTKIDEQTWKDKGQCAQPKSVCAWTVDIRERPGWLIFPGMASCRLTRVRQRKRESKPSTALGNRGTLVLAWCQYVMGVDAAVWVLWPWVLCPLVTTKYSRGRDWSSHIADQSWSVHPLAPRKECVPVWICLNSHGLYHAYSLGTYNQHGWPDWWT